MMGCSASFPNHTTPWKKTTCAPGDFQIASVSLSHNTKNTLRESWKLVEPVKTETGKAMFMRLFKTHPNIQDTFPSFKGVSLDELMNSRSLYLHANRVMGVVENAISALDDADEVIESLTNLGKKHQPWSLTQEHFRVLGDALLWALQEMLNTECTNQVIEAWKEMFKFITRPMLNGVEGDVF